MGSLTFMFEDYEHENNKPSFLGAFEHVLKTFCEMHGLPDKVLAEVDVDLDFWMFIRLV